MLPSTELNITVYKSSKTVYFFRLKQGHKVSIPISIS